MVDRGVTLATVRLTRPGLRIAWAASRAPGALQPFRMVIA